MNEERTNQKALESLAKRDWNSAQKLLFKNANLFKSYKTYNNLGYYLVTEGLICKDGRFLNAYNRGMKYLLKSAEIKSSAQNAFAIVSALNSKIEHVSSRKRAKILQEVIWWLKKGLSIENSKEMHYNLLRFLYLTDSKSNELIRLSDEVVKEILCEESVSLRLEILRINKKSTAGLKFIEKHKDLLDEIDLLMFYTTNKMYEKGFELCDTICQKFSINEYIASAIIECCVKTNHFNAAEHYASLIQENEESIQYERKKNWCPNVFCNFLHTQGYRQKNILEYRMMPAFIPVCCYFGCDMHNIPW